MSRLILIGITLVALAASAANAQQRAGRMGPERERRMQEMPPGPQNIAPPPRGMAEEQMRRDQPPGSTRMSSEELRQLRRDVNNAGREIYRRDPGQRRRRF